MKAVELGYDYAKATFPCPLPLRVEKMDKTGGYIMIDGNTAAALGCIFAGATVAAWYPDHAVHLLDGCVQGLRRSHAHRPHERPQELRIHPGGG